LAETAKVPADRRTQIIESVVEIINEHGMSGTTTARIAAEVGITEPALYRHFKNKNMILLAALEEASNSLIQATMSAAAGEEDTVERLRLMSAAFYDFVISRPAEARVLFEAASWTRDEEFRLAVRGLVSDLLAVVEAVLNVGIFEGALKPDLDVPLAAWEIVSLGMTIYVVSILDLADVLTKDKAMTTVERVLSSITVDKKTGKENIQ